MVLGHSQHRGDTSLPAMLRLAQGAMSHDPDGDRAELLDLIRTANGIQGNPT
jgi:hypothetical protein